MYMFSKMYFSKFLRLFNIYCFQNLNTIKIKVSIRFLLQSPINNPNTGAEYCKSGLHNDSSRLQATLPLLPNGPCPPRLILNY